jgi:hypothetical protein
LGAGFFEPAAMDHADADPRLADIDVAHLLVDQPFRDRLLRIALKLGRRNMGAFSSLRAPFLARHGTSPGFSTRHGQR